MKILAMFPGQGSQVVGMAREILEQFPYAVATFEEAEDASGCGIRRLCLEGPDDELRLTAHAQPCILTVSIAFFRVLQQELSLRADLFAGHSLGEYSALVAAGKLDFARAVHLVRQRGLFMQQAVPAGIGAMAAIMNAPIDALEEACQKYSTDADGLVQVANYNMEQQTVVAGHKAAVDVLCTDFAARGLRVVKLPVSAPCHSRLMQPARDAMRPLLESTSLHRNNNKLIVNLSGKLVEDYQTSLLVDQIDHPVRWTETMATALHEGVDTFVEVGPGKVLLGFVRRAVGRDPAKKCFASDPLVEILKPLADHLATNL